MTALACARCHIDQPDERSLTRHLIDEELIAPSVALEMVRKARNGSPTTGPAPFFAPDRSSPVGEESPHVKELPAKEAAVVEVKGPDRCEHCARRKQDGRGPCGWHGGEKGTPNAARDHRRKKAKKPAPPKDDVWVTHTTTESVIAQSGATFLRQLKELRSRLDEKIAHVEDLIQLL